MEMRMLEVVAVNYWIYVRAGNFLIKMSGITNIFKKCAKDLSSLDFHFWSHARGAIIIHPANVVGFEL